jgi:hypothetical protein
MAMQAEVSEILMLIEVETFMKVFIEWKWRLRRCIEQGGDYSDDGYRRFPLIGGVVSI